MSVNIETQIDYNEGKKSMPIEFVQSMMHSNDYDLLKKVQKELLPRELSNFGAQTANGVVSANILSNKLTFYASDPRSYLDMLESYFTADFRAVATTQADVVLPSFIEVGGIHACIKTLTIKIGEIILMRLDDYNKWYNINNLVTHSAEYADYMLGTSLDGQTDYQDEIDYVKKLSYTIIGSGYDDTGGASENLVTLVGSTLLTDVQVGDVLMITSGGAAPARPTQFGRVTAVLTDLTMNVTGLTRVDIATPDLTSITIVRRLKSSTRARIMNQDATCKIQWRLPVGCLSFLKYFPLPYIESYAPLEIEFEFVDPRLCITLRDPTAARSAAIPEIPGEGEDPPIPAVPAMDITDNKIGYILSNPRFVVALVEPSEKVRDMHKSLYNGNGLWFPYVNYRHFLDRIDANSTNELLTFPANLSSARHVFTVLTSQNNDIATVAATQVIQSQSTFFRSSINYFRFQSGTMQFPDYGPCMVSNYMAGEAWAQLLLTFNIKENTVHKSRIRPWEWQSTTSEKFIIATPLSKDSSMWTGVAVKNNFLEMILNKAAVAVDYNAHTYIGYDCALVISKDRCNVFD